MSKSETRNLSHATCFPFLSLPRELQIEICRLSLSPHVDFTLRDRRRCHQYDDNGVIHAADSDGDDGDSDSDNDDNGFLDYNLTIATALLLVNKDVSGVTRDILSRLHTLHTLLSTSIVHGRIIQCPGPEFLSVCHLSRLILRSFMEVALSFLSSSPSIHATRCLVITSRMLYNNDYKNRWAWSPAREGPDTQEYTPFASSLRSNMPRLQEVALFVPYTARETRFYCSNAPEEMCDMLKDGRLEVVRFLFKEELRADYDMMEHFLVRDVMRPNLEWSDGMGSQEYWERCKALLNAPDLLAMTRESDERARQWPDAKTVVAFRRLA